ASGGGGSVVFVNEDAPQDLPFGMQGIRELFPGPLQFEIQTEGGDLDTQLDFP
ncbi:unnamed protein product, partial [Effrenium voratum]